METKLETRLATAFLKSDPSMQLRLCRFSNEKFEIEYEVANFVPPKVTESWWPTFSHEEYCVTLAFEGDAKTLPSQFKGPIRVNLLRKFLKQKVPVTLRFESLAPSHSDLLIPIVTIW
jgi:hypothetical protein